jgi:hypothetical protein
MSIFATLTASRRLTGSDRPTIAPLGARRQLSIATPAELASI